MQGATRIMAFIPTPRAARAALRYDLFGQDVVNTLWFLKADTAFDGTDCETLATALASWSTSELLEDLSEDIVLKDVSVVAQDSTTAPAYLYVELVAGAGEVVQPASPSTNAVCVKFNTAERGRSGRGRNFVGGIPVSVIEGNTLGGVWSDAIVDHYIALPTYAAPYTHVVVSHQVDFASRAEGYAQAVTSYQIVQRFIRQQRKRETGVGS